MEGLRGILKKHSASVLTPPALRPVAERVRSIWRSSPWELDPETKSLSLTSPSALPLPSFLPWEPSRSSLTFTGRLGDWIKTGSSKFLTNAREQSYRLRSLELIQAALTNSESQ